MADHADSFFEGLDDAEDVSTPPVTDTPAPQAEKPAVAEKPADKPAEKQPDKAVEKPAEEPTKGAAPDKAPEKPAAAEVRASEQPDPRKWVPVGAHVELRNQLKELQEKIKAIENPPKPKPTEPEFTQDPKGYVDHRVAAALEQLETGLKPVAEKAEKADATAAETRFYAALTNAEHQFVATQPDYYAALDHLRNLRAQEIATLNPEVTREQMTQLLHREELQLAASILQTGRNPSEVAYRLAKARGYAPAPPPKPAEPEKKPAAPEKVAELLPPVKEPAKLAPDLTLGTGTGSPVTEDVSEDPFEAAWKEVFGQKKRA
jgi:hypothetical protein